ncbi:hypothetical protein MASR2M117_03120 [Paludibacter sp.]
MKKLIFSALIFFSAVSFAQTPKITGSEVLNLPQSQTGYSPVISPAGDYVLLTGIDLQGLKKYDLNSKQLTALTKDKGAGFDVQISHDGKIIAYRSQIYKNRLRYTTLKTLNLNTGKQQDFIKESRDLEKFIIKDGTVLAVEKGVIKSKRITGKQLAKTPAISSVRQGQLYISKDKQANHLSPAGKQYNYLWTSISPDETKMLYYVIELGKAFVSNLDGTNAVSLGTLRTPKWAGNNWVVGMEDYDDGSVVTSSKIVMVSATGKNRTDLTDKSMIATNPSASLDGRRIVFNTADGKVHLITIEF